MGALTLITSHPTTSFCRLCAVHKQPTPLGGTVLLLAYYDQRYVEPPRHAVPCVIES